RSPSVVTSLRLIHQASRALTRSFSLDLPCTRSKVHFTSAAVKGLPSCHLTPSRNLKVSSVPSSLHDQLSARSGTIDCKLFCFTFGSNMTRLLNTPMIGATIEIVPSSDCPLLLRLRRIGDDQAEKQTCRRCGISTNFHLFLPIAGPISSAAETTATAAAGQPSIP